MNRYKIITLIVLLLGAGSVQAQEDDTKKKQKRTLELPKAGDIGLGIDVVPMFRYVGNLFNGNLDNNYNSFGGEYALPGVSLGNDNVINRPTVSIMGKYMITDNFAARLNVGILTVRQNDRMYSDNDAALAKDPLSEAEVIDERISNQSGASFSVGAEYRRGYRWIQGFAGLNLLYAFSENNVHYNYGNAVTEINQTPSRNTWSASAVNHPSYWTRTYVTDHYNNGSNSYFGLGAHMGVELFFTSHFSLGGEVSINALWKNGAAEYMKTEGFNTLNNQVETRIETISPGNKSFVFGTQNLGGKLYFMFYF